MSEERQYAREPQGSRFHIEGGMNTCLPTDALPAGRWAYLQNVRRYLEGRTVARAPQGNNVLSGAVGGPAPVTSIARLNDATPNGPGAGYVLVIGAGGKMYVNATQVLSGMSGLPLSTVTFRPDASPQPWMYVADDDTGMWKVRSDATVWKDGIMEPQAAPLIGLNGTTITGNFTLNVNAAPWTNFGGANNSTNYGETSYGGGGADLGPGIIGNLVPGSTLAITVSGSATINGGTHAPGDAGLTTASYPGHFVIGGSTKIVLGAFTDINGNVVNTTSGGTTPAVYSVGASASLTVPPTAVQFQIGIDSSANTFFNNTGAFAVTFTQTISAASPNLSFAGPITAAIFGDSPHSGAVATYIWKNPNDSGSGTPRTTGDAANTASGNSLIFDSTPEDGTVPVQWSSLDSTGATVSTFPLYSPPLESAGYQDFNVCITGNLFVPQAGSYTFQIKNKDQVMFGIGGGATVSGGFVTGTFAQTMTVVSGLPLVYVSAVNGSGGAVTQTITVTFPAQGIYAFEVDWDYWYHTGRSLIIQASPTPGAGVATIPPLNGSLYHINAQYRYVYRSSVTGAQSNPSPESAAETIPLQANSVTSFWSPDPQVDTVDYYRMDEGLDNFTYVASGPNDNANSGKNTPIIDTLTDTAAAANQILDFTKYEPFPSIDLPAKGVINVGNNGAITWVSGTQFNIRWLAGTVILIGSPTSVAYTLIARPTPASFATNTAYVVGNVIFDGSHYQKVTIGGTSGGSVPAWNHSGGTTVSNTVTFQDVGTRLDLISGTTTTMQIPGVPGGNNLAYQIAEPILAAQPSPTLWGPTANTAFAFGIDPLNTGDLVWTNGNDFDSASDSNRLVVTSPAEPLMNGTVSGEVNLLFSTERYWLIIPTFTQAYATVAGIVGNQWTLVQSGGTRGLYMRYCICTDGAGTTFFRAKDCIAVTEGGSAEKSITDDIYNLFPHEGFIPQPVVIGGQTVYPPDDTRPNAQLLSFGDGYLYYDYQDTNGIQRTLVYDVAGKGWSVDVYGTTAVSHYWQPGPNVNQVLTGCADGTVRALGTGGNETGTAIICTPSMNGGDARAQKKFGDIFVQAIIQNGFPVSLAFYTNRYGTTLGGISPTSLTGTGALTPYVIDVTSGFGVNLIDVSAQLSWPLISGNILDQWEPTWLSRPEVTQDRPTDWTDAGYPGAKFVQGCRLERDTFNASKVFAIQNGDDGTLNVPAETPCVFNGQSIQAFSVSPFIAHTLRIVSTDGVPWQVWGTEFIYQPYPELCMQWSTELVSYAPGWQHIRAFNIPYIATAGVTLTLTFDQWPQITIVGKLPATSSQLYPTKTFVQCPPNKSKLMGFTLSSTQRFRVFAPQIEVWVGGWNRSDPYSIVHPIGGRASDGAEV